MNIEYTHAALVRRLVKPAEVLFAQVTPFKIALIHSVLGIAGELGELEELADAVSKWDVTPETKTNFIEETGDLFFYCRDIRHVLELSPFVSVAVHPKYSPAVDVGEVVDASKRIAIYNQAVTADALIRITDALNRLESYYEHELTIMGSSRCESLQANLDKLNKRFPEGYTDKAAKDRVDKQPLDLQPNLHDG